MKKLFKKVGAFLRHTWVWTLLLVLFVALLVWFVGPLLAVNDYKFWEGSTSRLLTISVLFLIWGLTMVFVSWRAGVLKKPSKIPKTARTVSAVRRAWTKNRKSFACVSRMHGKP
jgi:type VI protein secretion system component VasK